MPKKQSSPEMSSLAAMHLNTGSLFDDPDYANPARELGRKLGLSEEEIENKLLPGLNDIMDAHCADMRSLAASVLSQDETKGQK